MKRKALLCPIAHSQQVVILFILAFAAMWPGICQAQARVVLYDDWFHAATCRLLTDTLDGEPRHTLAVTYDEGNVVVPMGSALIFTLRGGKTVELTSDREVDARRDVQRRRYRTHTDVYITCFYPVAEDQLALLAQHEVTRLKIMTATGWIERKATNRKASFAIARQARP